MARQRVTLVGSPNQRNYDSLQTLIDGKDQRFIGGIITVVENPFSQHPTPYFEKRPGFEVVVTPETSSNGEMVFFSIGQNKYVSAFVTGGTSTLYVGTTSCGTTA